MEPQPLGKEQVVYEPTSHEVVVLNPTAAFIFGACDGTRTVVELLDVMVGRFAAPAEVLEKDLLATLELFRRKNLLEA